MSANRSFKELEIWKRSRVFRNEVFKLVKKFPKEEKFLLVDQLIRASRSVTANIAEGHGRFHFQENIQYCRIARGSITECLDHLICANDCKYISKEVLKNYESEIEEISRMINGYINYLKKKKVES